MLIFVCCIAIITIIGLIYIHKSEYFEYFSNVRLTTDYTTVNINFPSHNEVDRDITYLDKIFNGKLKIIYDTNQHNSDILYTDTMNYVLNENTSLYLLAVTNEKKQICFIKHPDVQDNGDISELMNAKIGYINNSDIAIMKVLFLACGLDFDEKQCIRYDTFDEASNALFVKKSIKALFMYCNFELPAFKSAFENVKLSMYGFDNVNTDKLHFLLPMATIKNVNYKLVFKKFNDRFPVKKTLVFDNLLVTKNSGHTYLYEYIVRYFSKNFEYVNLYAQHYNIHPLTKYILNDYENIKKTNIFGNVDKIQNNSLTLMETFDTKHMNFEPTTPLKGFFDINDNILTIFDTQIHSTPLQVGDIITLTKQKHDIENGIYVVLSIDTMKQETKLQALASKQPIEDVSDPRFICSNDRNIAIKGLCESAYNTAGNKKQKGTWDKPCNIDTECPFFQKNKNYKNYRGGCNNGYCELPIGVSRISFRRYQGKPWCHGCPDKSDPVCCESQEKPDYAFVLDEYERLPKVKEQFTNDYLVGEYSKPISTNVYHYELSNDEINIQLQTLINKSIKPETEQLDFKAFIPIMINHAGLKDYGIFDINIISKDISPFDGSPISCDYKIEFTIYRDEKSHGKKISTELNQDISTNMITVKYVDVLGIVPQYDVGDLYPKGVNDTKNNVASSGIRCGQTSFQTILGEQSFQKYAEKRNKKLLQEFNLNAL